MLANGLPRCLVGLTPNRISKIPKSVPKKKYLRLRSDLSELFTDLRLRLYV